MDEDNDGQQLPWLQLRAVHVQVQAVFVQPCNVMKNEKENEHKNINKCCFTDLRMSKKMFCRVIVLAIKLGKPYAIC